MIERLRQEQERFRLARQKTLRLIQESMATAEPRYVIEVTGFWLSLWKRERRAELGKPKGRACEA